MVVVLLLVVVEVADLMLQLVMVRRQTTSFPPTPQFCPSLCVLCMPHCHTKQDSQLLAILHLLETHKCTLTLSHAHTHWARTQRKHSLTHSLSHTAHTHACTHMRTHTHQPHTTQHGTTYRPPPPLPSAAHIHAGGRKNTDICIFLSLI